MTENGPRQTTYFVDAVSRFLESATWLNDSHLPSVVALQGLACELDLQPSAALYAQFGLYHRSLLKEKPVEPSSVNPFEELLRR
jgi:hypothetical protein